MSERQAASPANLRFLDRWFAVREAALSRDIDLAAFVAGRRALACRLFLPKSRFIICANASVPWPILNRPPYDLEIMNDTAGFAATFHNYYYLVPDRMDAMIAATSRLVRETKAFPSRELIRRATGSPQPTDPAFGGLIWFLATRALISRGFEADEASRDATLESGRDRRLVYLRSRLARLSWEAKELADLLDLYDAENALFLIDQRSLTHDLDLEDLLALRRLLPSLRGRAIVLLYDSEAAQIFEDAAPTPWRHSNLPYARWLPSHIARNYKEPPLKQTMKPNPAPLPLTRDIQRQP